MPFNWPVFRTRALSSIVFVVVMLGGLFWNQWSFLGLFTIIHFGCWIEYQRLVDRIDPDYKSISVIHRYGVMLAGWGFMLWMTGSENGIAGIGFWMLVVGTIAMHIDILISRKWKLIAHSLMGLLYISLGLGALINIGLSENLLADEASNDTRMKSGLLFTLAIITSIWINDTMAYIVGSIIGKTPLSAISPKKTWEGTLGGALLCVIVTGTCFSTLLSHSFAASINSFHWFSIAAISAVFGTFGDLFESKLKRLAGVKDSGNMMPGHGGFLDRFDSLLLAAPFVWLYIWLFV